MRLVPLNAVKEGCYLARTIYDDDGRILLKEGVQLTSSLLNRIKDIGIFSLYIKDNYSDEIIEDIIKPELRQKAILTVKNTFYSFEKYSSYSDIAQTSSKNKNLALKKRQEYFQSIEKIAEEIIDEILSHKNILVNLVDIKSLDNYTYQHCVNVAVLSLILGIQLQLTRPELYTLCIGALIHDMGKTMIPKSILFKEGPLTDEEFEIIKQHTIKGYDYLKENNDISPVSRIIALQHHEKIDGTGYPEGRKGNEINKFARIVAIADVYDALTSDRPYRKALNPSEALEYILANGSTHFDYQMVKAFSKAVVPYPEGTLVLLSTGYIGVVEKNYLNLPLRPKVKILKDSQGNNIENEAIKLSEQINIVIKKVLYTIPE